jgi:multiple sugar transport system permease protein/putative aldouronate transport system permease protein
MVARGINDTLIGRFREEPLFYFLNLSILGIVTVLVAYPLLYVISSSFSSAEAVIAGQVRLFPIQPTLDGYKAVFQYDAVWVGYANSLFYMVAGTTVNVAMTTVVAYPLSRKDFYGRNIIMFLFAFTMFFRGGLIPTYLLVRTLGLLDTRAAMILPKAIAVWNLIIVRTYFQSNIPDTLYDAAKVDGASNTRMLFMLVLPLSGPVIAVITLFYAVGHWNAFFDALIYLRDAALKPLQLVLREVLVANSSDLENMIMESMSGAELEQLAQLQYLQALLQYSLIVVAMVPVLIAYPFVQRYFVQGVMIGAIKG